MRLSKTLVFALLVIMVATLPTISGCSGPAATPSSSAPPPSQAGPLTLESVIEGAKKEGKLSIYASYSADQAKEIHNAFKQKYPFIEFEHLNIGGADVTTRIGMEIKANAPTADAAIAGSAESWTLGRDGLLKQVDWAALGVNPGEIDNPYQVTVATTVRALAWNTKLVPAADAPKTWEDLLDPKWKGKIGFARQAYNFAELAPVWGEARTLDYTKKLMENKPMIVKGTSEVPSLLAAGEISVAIVTDLTIKDVSEKGAPIAWSWPDPVAGSLMDYIVPNAARNPNAAILYGVWLASPEGAAAYEKATWRGNLLAPNSGMVEKTKGKQFSFYNVQRADERAAMLDKVEKLFP